MTKQAVTPSMLDVLVEHIDGRRVARQRRWTRSGRYNTLTVLARRGWLRCGPPNRRNLRLFAWTEITERGREALAAALGEAADRLAAAARAGVKIEVRPETMASVLRLLVGPASVLQERHPGPPPAETRVESGR